MLKISYNILKTLVHLPEDTKEIADILTSCGLEVGRHYSRINNDGRFDNLSVAKVIECEKHPNADKLKILQVDAGLGENLKIVCGAPNIAKGQTVILAPIGTTIVNCNEEKFVIKEAKIRGELSQGMICSAYEIGFGQEKDEIFLLPKYLNAGDSLLSYVSELNDYIYEIEITPNRGDACSHLGVARDLSAYFNRPLIYPEITEFYTETCPIEVISEDKNLCSKYCCAVISGVETKESPLFFQNILKNCGIQPKNAIVDVLNYVMLEIGQPMHAYDFDKISHNKIVIKKANIGDSFNALNGSRYTLSKDNIVICDKDVPISVAGVIGDYNSAVSFNTKKIFLESANFDPKLIRKSSKSLGAKTEASFRFERGIANVQNFAMYRVFYLVKQIFPDAKIDFASEKIFSIETLKPKQIEFSVENFHKISGIIIDKYRIIEILKRLEFNILNEKEGILYLEVPTVKGDVLREIDVIEEILRINGFDKVQEKEDLSFKYSLQSRKDFINLQLKRDISQCLTGANFYEIRTNPIIFDQKITKNGLSTTDSLVYLKNPISSDLNVLRPTLLISAMQVVLHNANRQVKEMRIFEFGRIYLKHINDIIEKDVLSMLIFQNDVQKRWNKTGQIYTIYTLLYEVEKILIHSGIKKFEREISQNENSITLSIQGQVFAVLSEVTTPIKNNFNIEGLIFYAEIDWNFIIFKKNKEEIKFCSIPKFQKIERDISFYINECTNYSDIEKNIFANGGKLLNNIYVIDVYNDKKSDGIRKSYTLRLEFQPENNDLDTEQMLDIMQNISSSLETELFVTIR